jgi:hypothetical protein
LRGVVEGVLIKGGTLSFSSDGKKDFLFESLSRVLGAVGTPDFIEFTSISYPTFPNFLWLV